MKKIKNNVRGITLVSLIITIIILLILSSIAIYSGNDVLKASRFTKFTTELKIMQTHVNQLYDKYKSGDNEILNIGKELDTVQEQANTVFTSNASGITDPTGYRYFDQETIQSLNIEGIEEEFFINIEKRSVVSYKGFKYEGTTYYTLEQMNSGLYNVEYENKNTGTPTFDISVEAIEKGKWKISVSDIEYDGYIDKWEIKYKLEGEENWKTSKNFEFSVDEEGVYIITVSNKDITVNEKRTSVGVKEIEPEISSITNLSTMLYGVIEIEFLEGTGYQRVTMPNEPILKDEMKAVYWSKDENGEIDLTNPVNNTYEMTSGSTNFKKGNWYQYLAQTGSADGKTSRWANAITSDGSYYVWIPRYAYRIIYFNSQENEDAYRAGTLTEEAALASGKIIGYSDARGIVDKDGKRPTGVTSTTSISVNNKYFRTHPVFDDNVDEGGWDSKLAGIWVMKYEASKGADGKTPKSVPNANSWTYMSIGKMFEAAKILTTTNIDAHMIKNSEWGAVAYLSESKYGRNGTEISMNQCIKLITGAGKTEGENSIYENSYYNAIPTEEQQYNGKIGQLSSTTGNIYGIYDLSGGITEYVMAFYADEEGKICIGNSQSANTGFNGYLTDGTEITDGIEFPKKKYYQLYSNIITGKNLGDAMYEVRNHNQYSVNVSHSWPAMQRAGNAGDKAGIYAISAQGGYGNWAWGSRVCLAIQ